MAQIEVRIPAMGEGIIEVTLTKWLVKSGDHVKAEQSLAEIATDKVDSEIPSPAAGYIIKLVYSEGEVPKVNEVIAVLETGDHRPAREEKTISPDAVKKTSPAAKMDLVEMERHPKTVAAKEPSNLTDTGFISPFIRHLARQRGLSFSELRQIDGTGKGGRITKDDIHQYLLSGRLYEEPEPVLAQLPDVNAPAAINTEAVVTEISPDVETVPMDRVRKLIAANMLQSKKTSPHVTSFAEADVTRVVEWRNRVKESFLSKQHINLTFTPLFVEVIAKALKDFPLINVSVDGDRLLLKKNINIGIATALPEGNLIVPVIKKADCENLQRLAAIIHDLVNRARENKLLSSEIKGGTFTITNIGQYKSLTGTPIINQPESAILAIGTIAKKPWAVKTNEGYGLAVRDIVMLSLTYDHRVIDGALGGNFLNRIVLYLENFDTAREV